MKANYKISHDGLIVIKEPTDNDPRGYPINDTMPEWAVYQDWLAAGNTPEVIPVEPIPVPLFVTPLQMRKALRQIGMRQSVEQLVKTLDEDAQDAWEYATLIDRNNPLIGAVATSLNKTDEEIDNLFILAATL